MEKLVVFCSTFFHFFSVATKVGASEARFAPIDLVTQSVCLFTMGEKNLPKMNECPLERDHVKKEMVSSSVPSNFFRGVLATLVFSGVVCYEKEKMFCPKWDEKKASKNPVFPTNYPNLQCEKERWVGCAGQLL